MANTPERNEAATTRDGRDITRPWINALMPLATEDTVLIERGGGDFLLYQEVLRDDHVKAAVEQRRRAVISRPWEVRPGGKRAIDKAAAAFLEENINAIGWDAICDKMLMGIFYGLAVAEALWVPDGRHWRLGGVKVRNRRRFAFDQDGIERPLFFYHPAQAIAPVGLDSSRKDGGLALEDGLDFNDRGEIAAQIRSRGCNDPDIILAPGGGIGHLGRTNRRARAVQKSLGVLGNFLFPHF